MVFFITCLRALAACLITNAHYTGVYPTDLIANGGMIGDVLFFAVSGYCLCNVRQSFLPWYGKRLWRCYLPVVLMTALYMLLGCYSLADHNALWWYVYPTYYHFVASIIVLYIPFYVVMKLPQLRDRLPLVMLGVAAAWLLVYVFAYDKSYYHIDTVREPMVRFLFMESMLLGAWFRQHDAKLRSRFDWRWAAAVVMMLGVYFVSKLLFSKRAALAPLQLLNQAAVFALLCCLFRTFAGLDSALEKLPKPVKKCIGFLAQITLEIYVVQYVLIDVLRPVAGFPLNWLLLTGSILASAFVLHLVCGLIYRACDTMLARTRRNA